MADRSSLNWQVLDQINDLIAERGISKTELVELSGIKRNTLFVKLRGETALTTDDIAKIAKALGADPEMIMRKAWDGRMSAKPLAPVADLDARRKNVGGQGDTAEPERKVAHPEIPDHDNGETKE